MLLNVHVKNFALIDEADLDLNEGLNILTGETGAGKSILIDAVSAGLGGRTKSDVIGSRAEEAFISLTFSIDTDAKKKTLEEMDVSTEYDTILISRKISPSKSIFKINDEPATASKVRQVTELLIDIHGQHEHQSLLRSEKQLDILDHFAKDEELIQRVGEAYAIFGDAKKEADSFNLDEEAKNREIDFLLFEINEIEAAALKENEKAELEEKLKKFNNANKIAEGVASALKSLSEGGSNVSDELGNALRDISKAATLDNELSNSEKSLTDAAEIITDAIRELKSYADSLDFDKSELIETENRLDTIHHLMSKYGNSYEQIISSLEARKEKLEKYKNYDEGKSKALKKLDEAKDNLERVTEELSAARKNAKAPLEESIKKALNELNFLDVKFEIAFSKAESFTPNGNDEVTYLISTNPGEKILPLSEVASGGELSRVMLGFKTVLAERDEIPTLIFDEIDAGISGKTAGLVAKKLSEIARYHQVICITHLPQIAAYSDSHYAIEKSVDEKIGKTITSVKLLDDDGEINELARLLGGDVVTGASYDNARELKKLAKS